MTPSHSSLLICCPIASLIEKGTDLHLKNFETEPTFKCSVARWADIILSSSFNSDSCANQDKASVTIVSLIMIVLLQLPSLALAAKW